jgi:hypothetical protein
MHCPTTWECEEITVYEVSDKEECNLIHLEDEEKKLNQYKK